MKSGKMRHVIEAQRATATINDAGTPEEAWTTFATLRAELVQRSTEEFLRGPGETSETTVVFRTRYLADLQDEDRILFDGLGFDIEEMVELGHRQGLELRCREVRP
ncbi:phage head closure protein [Litorisediminicola beolgyonensis]|uniref:Phage head closure protein n=1 Tax=Litorisediminicola beolgyonensis TaxID=1173614 RepID=A0ABW3ZES3_9RHOB